MHLPSSLVWNSIIEKKVRFYCSGYTKPLYSLSTIIDKSFHIILNDYIPSGSQAISFQSMQLISPLVNTYETRNEHTVQMLNSGLTVYLYGLSQAHLAG